MQEKLEKKTEESIKKILDEGITTNNLDHLYKLTKINHIAKEDGNMNYGNYSGRGPSRGHYVSWDTNVTSLNLMFSHLVVFWGFN